jgi:hypothetical protein
LDQVRTGETATDLQSRFQDWINDFIQEDNFKEYKLELYGNAESDPAAKKTLFLKTTIQFNPTPGALVKSSAIPAVGYPGNEGFTSKEFIELAREKAILEAKHEILTDKFEQLEDEIHELREAVETTPEDNQPKTMGEVVNQALYSNADKIIGLLVDKLMGTGNNFSLGNIEASAPANDLFNKMCTLEPNFPDHLLMLYNLRSNNPLVYSIALAKLQEM